jgi:hypothetical protein
MVLSGPEAIPKMFAPAGFTADGEAEQPGAQVMLQKSCVPELVVMLKGWNVVPELENVGEVVIVELNITGGVVTCAKDASEKQKSVKAIRKRRVVIFWSLLEFVITAP